MDVVLFNLKHMTVKHWENIINQVCSSSRDYDAVADRIADFFKDNYDAVEVTVPGYTNRFMQFSNKEKYVEFYLKWM